VVQHSLTSLGKLRFYAEGVRQFQLRVAATLGTKAIERCNTEGVGEFTEELRELFQSYLAIENLIPGLKQPWAGIGERLRRKNRFCPANLTMTLSKRWLILIPA
jgi:hypothetical protein